MKRINLLLIIFALLLLAACGGENKKGGEDVVVGTWGGDYHDFLENYVNPEITGDYEVVFVPENTGSRLAKVQVEKEGKGTFDVVNMQDTVMQQLINEDIMQELDYDKIPNAKNISEGLEHPFFIPHIYSAGALLYNERLVEGDIPDSWEAMWDPKYKGKVGVYVDIFDRYLFAAAVLEDVAENHEWDKAWDKLIQLKDNDPKFYTSQEQLATALQTGEIAITITWKARAEQWNNAGGDPIGYVIPIEGSYPTIYGTGIPKNANNVEDAYDYLNAMLEPDAQISFAQNMGYAPTVDNAELTDELIESIGFSEEEQSKLMNIDIEYIAENYSAWKEKFDKEVAD